MKLLELLQDLEEFKRLRRFEWIEHDKFIVRRKGYLDQTLVLCNLNCLELEKYSPLLEDFLDDDWESF